MQTILGSGGAIGIELAKSLKQYTDIIRLVSRQPKKVNESDEILALDLLNPDDLVKAVKFTDGNWLINDEFKPITV